MERVLRLEGEMGEKFGHSITVHADSVKDAFKLVDINNTGFKEYLVKCVEDGVDFHIDVAGNELEYADELLLNIQEGDITVTPVPQGAGGGIGKILAAIAIVLVVFFVPVAGVNLGSAMLSFMGGGALTAAAVAGFVLTFGAINLAMTGLTEMMTPDPEGDKDQQSSYNFNGLEQNVIEGDPVPVLYGRLQVPGQPVNFEVTNAKTTFTEEIVWGGSLFGGKPQIVYRELT